MANMSNSIIFINGVQYFLDAGQPVMRVFYYDNGKWSLSSEVAIQSSPPNNVLYKWWLDISQNPQKMKFYDDTTWQLLNMV